MKQVKFFCCVCISPKLIKVSKEERSIVLFGSYCKSQKIATQVSVRKDRGMQLDSVLLDIWMFYIWTLNFETFDSMATLWDWLYSLVCLKVFRLSNAITFLRLFWGLWTIFLVYRNQLISDEAFLRIQCTGLQCVQGNLSSNVPGFHWFPLGLKC